MYVHINNNVQLIMKNIKQNRLTVNTCLKKFDEKEGN